MTPKAIFGPRRAPRSSDSSYLQIRLPTRFQDFFLGHLEASKISALSTQHMCASTTTATSTTSCAATTRLRPHALYVDLAVRRDYSSPDARALRRPRRAPRLLVSGRTRSTSTSSCTAATCLRSQRLHLNYAARPGASARRAARHGVRRRLLRAPQLRLAATLALLQPCCASRLLVLRQHWLYFEYAARRHDVVFRSHHVDHSSRLVLQTSRERQSRPQQLVGINSD
jgi:hypothetical protein